VRPPVTPVAGAAALVLEGAKLAGVRHWLPNAAVFTMPLLSGRLAGDGELGGPLLTFSAACAASAGAAFLADAHRRSESPVSEWTGERASDDGLLPIGFAWTAGAVCTVVAVAMAGAVAPPVALAVGTLGAVEVVGARFDGRPRRVARTVALALRILAGGVG
jgi:hypothetical protein